MLERVLGLRDTWKRPGSEPLPLPLPLVVMNQRC